MSDVGPGTRCDDDRESADGVLPVDPFGAVAPDPLTFPRIPQQLVPRPAPMRRMDRMAPLTVIEALPGFGKTTLAAAWAREHAARGARVVWIQASEELDRPDTFVEHLHRGLLHAGALGESAPSPVSGGERRWIAELARCAEPVVVVVDDAHHLRDAALLDGLLRLTVVAHPLHVVVCCDTDHAFHDAAERHGVETNTLRGADLEVGPELVPSFARAWGHEVAAADARALHRLVGGWLLPLRLVLDETPPAAETYATDAVRDFLARRVLPRLVGAAERGVASLARLGLLLPRSGADATGPHLPELVLAALTQAKGRFRGPGEPVRQARAAEDWPELERLWLQEGWALAGGDPDAFLTGYAALPSRVTRSHEGLLLAGVLADALASTAPELHWVQRVETMLRHYREAGTDLVGGPRGERPPLHHVGLLTAAMIGRRTEGRLAEARHLAAEAGVELSRARHLEPESVRSSQAAWCKLQSAVTHLLCGDLGAAVDLGTAAYQTGPSTLLGSGSAGFLAMAHAISGQTADARQWLAAHEEIDVAGAWAADLARMPARMARAMLAMDELDSAAAAGELAGVPLGTDASGLGPLALLVHTRFALLAGEPTAMLARLHHMGRVAAHQLREPDGVPRQVFDRCLVDLALAVGDANRAYAITGDGHGASRWLCAPAARLQLLADDPAQAMRIASAAVWRHDLRTRDRQELLVVHALASRVTGRADEALDSFRRAHALARDTGNIEAFLLMPREVLRELLDATGLELGADWATRLDAARPVYPCAVDLVRLSPRELEVLRRLPHHDSAAALARHLSVSVNTVKKQLGSLYAKLDAGNRSAALLRAQELGLLDTSPVADGF